MSMVATITRANSITYPLLFGYKSTENGQAQERLIRDRALIRTDVIVDLCGYRIDLDQLGAVSKASGPTEAASKLISAWRQRPGGVLCLLCS